MQVSLAGKVWPVSLMVARQNKIVDPLILKLLPVFTLWQNDKAAALNQLAQEYYEALLDIAYVAISRDTKISKDEFLDLPVTLPELIGAFSVIAQSTGLFAKSEGNDTLGEAQAPTGTIS